jgi:DNA-binding XRE family transcriptional regulator
MSVRTKKRLTKRSSLQKLPRKTKVSKPKESSTPWREVFKKELEEYGEAALMLRGSRHKAELTQEQLADALGISQHHISEMENGKRPIGKEMALRFGRLFKTDYRKFL